MASFKLNTVIEPKWSIELPDGTVKEFDPWKLQQDLFDSQQAAKGSQEMYDGIRKAFGLPIESEAVGQFTFTRNQCLAASAALGDFVDELPVSKKGLARIKSNDSSGSH